MPKDSDFGISLTILGIIICLFFADLLKMILHCFNLQVLLSNEFEHFS